ncbi:NmrA family protein-like protein [Cadophora sp. MPI-SDFR-AT-0126]|nr:NmrA family protein-like protein [Leotiomycetes sp. MPI-SDFR-AT-0126]
MNSRTIAIAGITGKFAQCIAKTLLADPNVSIRGYCRNSAKLSKAILDSSRFEVIRGEFDDPEVVRKFVHGSDIVICCYFGGADLMIKGQKVLIDACEQENVPRYVASDFAVDFTKIPDEAPFPKQSTKIIMEYLKSKKVQGVHILVGVLMETFWSPYFQLYDAQSRTLSHWGTREDIWELTTFQTAADYTAAIALDPYAAGVFRFLADRKSPIEIKNVFDEIYGQPLNLSSLGSLHALDESVHAAARAHPDDLTTWGAIGFTLWCINGKAYLGDVDNAKYPQVKTVDLEAFLRGHTVDDVHLADQSLGF